MTFSDLFNLLDPAQKGALSRSDLHESARRLGWHWHEAPVFAILDLFTVRKPISKKKFVAYLVQMAQDPRGPFGKVLLNSPLFSSAADSKTTVVLKQRRSDVHKNDQRHTLFKSKHKADNDLISLLKQISTPDTANTCLNFLKKKNIQPLEISADNTAVLIIDPQRSFTRGVWKQSIGCNAQLEVEPIRLAFEKCAQFLKANNRYIETMFTRCPFPPCSYDWDDIFTGVIDDRQLYFIKPGNSVLFPPTNGFREWVASFLDNGKDKLVIAGCTLNSCVRVSSIETQKYFKDKNLQVVVDLSLAGARTSNFVPSLLFDGMSAVESAVREMIDAGVWIAQGVRWT